VLSDVRGQRSFANSACQYLAKNWKPELIFVLQAGVYFTPVDSNGPTKYVPRSVQVDLEAGVCNHVSFHDVVNVKRGSCYCR
jgi:hypothetical protein